MISIYKYPLKTTDRQEIFMPVGAKVLTVQAQQGTPAIWAIVDTEAKHAPFKFEIYGTGHTIPPITAPLARREYIGTYQLQSGALIFHVFQIIIEP